MVDLKDFNPEGSVLRCHQLRMLEILEYIDTVCKTHDIPYWLSSGTLLGAVRHGGFIPWDDDLDIEMLREDYLKLINILLSSPTDKYVLQINKTDKNYISPFAKFRERSSVIYEDEDKDQNFKYRGICIDLFAVEKSALPLLKFSEKIQNRLYTLAKRKNDRWGVKIVLLNLLYVFTFGLVYPFLRLMAKVFAKDTYYQTYGTGFYAPRYLEEIFPLKQVLFEGKPFPSPGKEDEYLRRLYGDYMKLPDLDKIPRHIHNIKL